MNYVYPKLSEKDLCYMRLGGAGLGNILFTYARAIVFAKKNNLQMIWPTWFSFKFGPVLRNEFDKRFYNDLFINNSKYIDGFNKCWLLKTKQKVNENEKESFRKFDEKIIEFTGFNTLFSEIIDDSKIVYNDLVNNLNPKNKKALEFDFSNSVSFHIRLGDFNRSTEEEVKAGKHNSSLPINWFVNILNQIRDIVGEDVKAYVFSDGTDDELKPILSMNNVERITFGTSIADIISISRAKLFVASGSSFSMWGRYLGRMNTICCKNQLKQKILTKADNAFEIEVEDIIPEYFNDKIKEIFMM